MATKPLTQSTVQTAPGAAAFVAALLLPPLGVFLVRGFGSAFWIAAALTCFGFLPGVLFSMLMLFRPGLLPNRARI
jgi:uncharacterized membrane protein YqaE (UPF0057 family)